MDHQTFNIPESSLSELLNYFDEIQCSTQTVQDELASDLASEKALDKFDEISLVVAALQIENTKLWSKLDKLYGEVDTLRSENNKLRDEVKSQWEALNNVRCYKEKFY